MKRGCFPSSWLCLIERKALPCEIVLEFLKMSCLFVEMQCFSNTVFAPTERSSLWQIFPVDALPFLWQWQCSFCGKLVLALIGQVTRRVQSFPRRRWFEVAMGWWLFLSVCLGQPLPILRDWQSL